MTIADPRQRTAAEAIVHVCHRLWERGLVAGQDGNVSVRLAPDRILVTPAGFSKGDLTVHDLCVVSGTGDRLEGRHAPSSELSVHLRAYAKRADVHAVVHAHPVTATGFAVVGETLPHGVLPEITVLLGRIPLVPYATPGTPAVACAFDPWWEAHDVFLMANHGALTLGSDLVVAHQRMESLEHAARIVTAARLVGAVHALPPDEVVALESLHAARRRSP
jgi:L-fuculose-phosphate aldolase